MRKDRPFIFKIDTRNNKTLEIDLYSRIKYNFVIDWGDGSYEEVKYSPLSGNKDSICHSYTGENVYTVTISGNVEAMLFNSESRKCLVEVIDLGDCNWKSLSEMFIRCSNLQSFSEGITQFFKKWISINFSK
jgi:hypothetical protein